MPNQLMSVKRLAIKDAVGDRDKMSRGIVRKIGSADKDWVMEISDIFSKLDQLMANISFL
jgi:hypothetical protein